MTLHLERFHQIGARLDDVDATQKFYTKKLGAHFLKSFNPPGLLFFEFVGVRLLFERGNQPASLYFWVDDLDTAYAELVERGVTFETTPHMIHRDDDGVFGPAGQEEWMAFFKDPSGNTLALATRR